MKKDKKHIQKMVRSEMHIQFHTELDKYVSQIEPKYKITKEDKINVLISILSSIYNS